MTEYTHTHKLPYSLKEPPEPTESMLVEKTEAPRSLSHIYFSNLMGILMFVLDYLDKVILIEKRKYKAVCTCPSQTS